MQSNRNGELLNALRKVLHYVYNESGDAHINEVVETPGGLKATLVGQLESEVEDVFLSFDEQTGALRIVNQYGENLLEPSSTERWSEKEIDYFRFGKEYPLQPVEPTKEMDYELEME